MRRGPLIALLAWACLACERDERPAGSALPPSGIPQSGGTLVRRIDIDVVSLNPVLATSRVERYVGNYLFTPLVQLDRNLQPVPGIADSWTVSDDGLLYRFDLNRKATFSDRTPVRAKDVVFTLARIVDPASEAVQLVGAFANLDLTRTRAIDDYTVEIAFRERLASQLVRFNDLLVLPEHVYSKGDFRKDFNERAVGSGPYVLRAREPGREIVVDRRDDGWGEKPHVETVVFKVIADHATAFNALKRGDIDETAVTSDIWVREQNRSSRSIDFKRFYALNYNYIAWNNRHPILADRRVRRALASCIPIDVVIQDLFHGTARAMTGPFTPDDWAYNPTVPVIRHDVEAAKILLREAGWTDRDGNGILDKVGRPFEIELLIMSGSPTARQLAQILQQELKGVGVDLRINVMEGSTAIPRILSGNYEAAYLSWDLDPDPDPFALFHSSQFYPRGQNFVFYSNPAADTLIEEGRRELDQSKRKDIYWRLHEVLAEDQPYTWVVQVSLKWGINRRIHGVEASRGMGLFLWSPGEHAWWIARESQRQHARPRTPGPS